MALYLLLQVWIFYRFRDHDAGITYLLATLSFVPAIFWSARRAIQSEREIRGRWALFAAALLAEMLEFALLWVSCQWQVSLPFLYAPALCEVVSFSILLLLLSSPARTETPRLVSLVDITLAGTLCVGANAAFLLPHSDFTVGEWLTFLTSMRAVVLVSALIALRAARGEEERWLVWLITVYQGQDLLGSFLLNQVMAGWLHQTGATAIDCLMSVPPLGLLLVMLYGREPAHRASRRSSYAARSGMSLFLCAALAGLGLWMLPRHPALGVAAMVVAALSFVLRALLVHTHEMESADRLKDSLEHLRELAEQDALTSLRNRRGFDAALGDLVREDSSAYPVSLLLVDLDHFKSINDLHGHLLGDECLKHVARNLLRARRDEADAVCRLGGDEFCMLLPRTGLEEACELGRGVQLSLQSRAAELRHIGLTVSVGVAVCGRWNSDSKEDLIQRADQTLYLAKREGRDRVRSTSDGSGVLAASAR